MGSRALILSILCAVLTGCQSARETKPDLTATATKQDPYREVNLITWDDYKAHVRYQASILTLSSPLAEAPTDTAISRLVVRNLTSGKTIFRKDIDYRPLAAYPKVLDNGQALISEWEGGSAESVMIFSITPSDAKVILDESYRVDVSFIPVDVDQIDVFITSGCCGIGPFFTTRFTYDGKSYKPIASIPHETFTNLLLNGFTKRRN